MGTSMSSQGPNSSSPLLPPWAAPIELNDQNPNDQNLNDQNPNDQNPNDQNPNDQNPNDQNPNDQNPNDQNPATQPSSGKRFKGFRENLGNFVETRDSSSARKALKHYARSSSGGGRTATHRLSPATSTGASLINFLSGIGTLHSNHYGVDRYISIGDLNGMPVDSAIDELVTALTPENGDADKIRLSLNESLSTALQGVEEFDESAITSDILSTMLMSYLSEVIFMQIELDAGKAWEKASSAGVRLQAEKDLRELIKAEVQVKMRSKLSVDLKALSNESIKSIQDETIIDVWQEWESYNGND